MCGEISAMLRCDAKAWLGDRGICGYVAPLHIPRVSTCCRSLRYVFNDISWTHFFSFSNNQWVTIDHVDPKLDGVLGQVIRHHSQSTYEISVDGDGELTRPVCLPHTQLPVIETRVSRRMLVPAGNLIKVRACVRAFHLHCVEEDPCEDAELSSWYGERPRVSEVYLPRGLTRFSGHRNDSIVVAKGLGVHVALQQVYPFTGRCDMASILLAFGSVGALSVGAHLDGVGPHILSSNDGSDMSDDTLRRILECAFTYRKEFMDGKIVQWVDGSLDEMRELFEALDEGGEIKTFLTTLRAQTREPPARRTEAQAARMVADNTASWKRKLPADALVESSDDEPGFSMYETVYVCKLKRNPHLAKEALHSGPELEAVRASMQRSGFDSILPGGASILVEGDLVPAILNLINVHKLALKPYHLITTDKVRPIIHDVLDRLPKREKVKIRDADERVAGMVPHTGTGAYVVERTFLDVPRPLRNPESCTQSSTELHCGKNPRRFRRVPQSTSTETELASRFRDCALEEVSSRFASSEKVQLVHAHD